MAYLIAPTLMTLSVLNEWDHRISAGVNEGPADCIKINEVATALKKMKSHKGQVCQVQPYKPQEIFKVTGYWIYVIVLPSVL